MQPSAQKVTLNTWRHSAMQYSRIILSRVGGRGYLFILTCVFEWRILSIISLLLDCNVLILKLYLLTIKLTLTFLNILQIQRIAQSVHKFSIFSFYSSCNQHFCCRQIKNRPVNSKGHTMQAKVYDNFFLHWNIDACPLSYNCLMFELPKNTERLTFLKCFDVLCTSSKCLELQYEFELNHLLRNLILNSHRATTTKKRGLSSPN